MTVERVFRQKIAWFCGVVVSFFWLNKLVTHGVSQSCDHSAPLQFWVLSFLSFSFRFPLSFSHFFLVSRLLGLYCLSCPVFYFLLFLDFRRRTKHSWKSWWTLTWGSILLSASPSRRRRANPSPTLKSITTQVHAAAILGYSQSR